MSSHPFCRLRALVQRFLFAVVLTTLSACGEPQREPLNPTEVAAAFDSEALEALKGHVLIRRHEWGTGPWGIDSTLRASPVFPSVQRGLDSLGGRLYSINGGDDGYVEFAGTGGVGYKVSTVVWAYDCGRLAELWSRTTRGAGAGLRDPERTCERLGGWLQYPGDIYLGM